MTKQENIEYDREDVDRIENAINSQVEKGYNSRLKKWEIRNAIKDLPSDKAYGRDEVHNQFLKNLPENKIKDLLGIMNRSLRNKSVPDEWKIAIIMPIPKPEKNLEQPESYRPISLLSCVSKLMENMIAKRLTYLIETGKLLSKSQFGFRLRRGTIDPVIGLEDEIHKVINNKKVIIVVFFDIKSAYDTVDHTLLLNMLASKGITGEMLGWLKKFLTGRIFKSEKY